MSEKPQLTFDPSRADAELRLLRAYCKSVDQFSWTSDAYQQAISDHLLSRAWQGNCVIEIGSYRGGLSVQLAYLAKLLGQGFFFIDVDSPAILLTTRLLAELGLSANTGSFHGTFQSFAATVIPVQIPSLIVVDGDHEYEATKRDIATILALPRLPECIVFHDYSLRSDQTGENVQRAIADMLPGRPLALIGQRFTGQGHPTVANPQPDGHYWDVPGCEGALVDLSS